MQKPTFFFSYAQRISVLFCFRGQERRGQKKISESGETQVALKPFAWGLSRESSVPSSHVPCAPTTCIAWNLIVKTNDWKGTLCTSTEHKRHWRFMGIFVKPHLSDVSSSHYEHTTQHPATRNAFFTNISNCQEIKRLKGHVWGNRSLELLIVLFLLHGVGVVTEGWLVL